MENERWNERRFGIRFKLSKPCGCPIGAGGLLDVKAAAVKGQRELVCLGDIWCGPKVVPE